MPEAGILYVCATPIGNLSDVSARLEETLRSVDVVYAEDTRRTAKLLSHLGIEVPTRSLFAGNERSRTAELVGQVLRGQKVALVSDAGMPTVSDPGATAVAEVRAAGGAVSVIPGPSAVTVSIAHSGFAGERFVFEGFLPRKAGERGRRLRALASDERAVVLFASPHRLLDDLTDLSETLGEERAITICRELTKLHEEVWTGSLAEAVSLWADKETRGEFTLVVAPGPAPEPDLSSGVEAARELIESGRSVSEAARSVAADSGLSRRAIYEALLSDQELS